jgi:GT2 family glycosyltransferase
VPEVTVLLAVHNGGDYVVAAVRSVLDQTFRDFELLVVDDASTDGTAELVSGLGDQRIRVLRNDRNIGQVASLNRGLREARGEIVARLDHDDVSHPLRLERQMAVLHREPSVGLVGAWMRLVDEEDRPLGNIDEPIEDRVDFVYWTLVQNLLISHPAATFRLAPVLELGGYDETMGPAEDKDLWRRLLLAGWDARVVPEFLVRYRVHESQLSQTRSELQQRNDDRSQEALLAELAPDAPARLLRLLLSDDLAVWSELTEGVDLVAALEALLAGTRERLGLDEDESRRLRERIRARVASVASSGWRARDGLWTQEGSRLADWSTDGVSGPGRSVRLAAPALRTADRAVAALTDRVTHLSALAPARARLRRSQALRRLYARITRGR